MSRIRAPVSPLSAWTAVWATRWRTRAFVAARRTFVATVVSRPSGSSPATGEVHGVHVFEDLVGRRGVREIGRHELDALALEGGRMACDASDDHPLGRQLPGDPAGDVAGHAGDQDHSHPTPPCLNIGPTRWPDSLCGNRAWATTIPRARRRAMIDPGTDEGTPGRAGNGHGSRRVPDAAVTDRPPVDAFREAAR